MLRFLLYKIGQWIVNFLPLQVAYAFARCLSDLQYTVSFVDRRNVRANIRKILNQDKVDERLVRGVFRNFGRYLVEFFRMVRDVDDKFIAEKVKCEGLSRIKEVLGKGKGAIIVTAHIGNWELGGNIIRKLGYPMLAVALPHKHNLVNNLFNQQREKCGISVVLPQNAIRKFLEKLKSNESVALVADRDFGTHGLVMNFFGYPTLLPKGPAVLSIKTGAGIIPSFFLYNPDGTYTLSFHQPVYPLEINDQTVSDEMLKNTISQYITVVEEKIRQFPDQWLMFREFWIK